MALVYVARHGETEWNRAGRYQGRCESQLSELGRRQAEALGDALASSGVRRVVSSPLQRCRESAQPLARRLGVEVEIDERLIEIAHGTWEGRLRADIQREDPQTFAAWRRTPERVRFEGGESLADVLARWRAFAREVDGKNDLAVVTHDAVVRIAVLDALGDSPAALWQPRVVNGGYAVLRVENGRWSVEVPCADEHLQGMIADTRVQAL